MGLAQAHLLRLLPMLLPGLRDQKKTHCLPAVGSFTWLLLGTQREIVGVCSSVPPRFRHQFLCRITHLLLIPRPQPPKHGIEYERTSFAALENLILKVS